MGRRAKSPTEKRVTGASKRPQPDVSAVEAALDGVPGFPPPAWLRDPRALGVWNRIAPELRRFNLLADADRDTFARYCYHFAGWIKASEQAPIGREWVEVKMTGSEERMPRLHPAVKARELHERHLVDIEDRFGGSPLARYRLIAQQAAHPGAFGDLFNPRRDDAPVDPAAPAPAAAASPLGILQRPTAH